MNIISSIEEYYGFDRYTWMICKNCNSRFIIYRPFMDDKFDKFTDCKFCKCEIDDSDIICDIVGLMANKTTLCA